MSKRTYYVNAAVFVSVSVLLGACGGGGGGSDSVTTSSAPVTISAANAEAVAAASYKTTAGLEGSGSGTTGFLTGAVTQTASVKIDLVDVLMSQVKTAPQRVSANAAASLTGVVFLEQPCTTSGSISITFDDVDQDGELSTGESVSFNANSCTEDGMTMNGSVTMNIVSVSGDPVTALPYSMQLSIQANNFTVTEGAESFALNGGMTMAESTNDGVSFTHSLTGSSIQVTEGGVGASLSNFSIGATEDDNTLAYTLDLNATVSSPELGGSVTIVTDTVFTGIEPNEPSSGQATITGANNSRVTLIAMGADNVRLEIDEDGNGTAETFVDTTWGAL